LTLVVVQTVRLIRIYRSVRGYKKYWSQRASEPSQRGDFLYVALGDSVANGIGASRPDYGYVGLIARKIQETTGRGVQIINVSVTGATTADVVREQLPKIRHLHPDLVTLDIGANDVNKKMPEEDFLRDFSTILDALPAGKTIVADLPTFKRGPKQSTLLRLNAEIHERVAAHHLRIAPIFDVTSATIGDWRTYGADLFHPSNRGHRNWFHAFEEPLDSIIEDAK
jgi:lysophospholipase L1-like esterase